MGLHRAAADAHAAGDLLGRELFVAEQLIDFGTLGSHALERHLLGTPNLVARHLAHHRITVVARGGLHEIVLGFAYISLVARVVDDHAAGHDKDKAVRGVLGNDVQIHHFHKQILNHVLGCHHVVGVAEEVTFQVAGVLRIDRGDDLAIVRDGVPYRIEAVPFPYLMSF
jgi:hypothetical protein